VNKRPLKLRLPYFFGQRNPGTTSAGNVPELIKPESVWERVDSGIEDLLRWADDGGNMLDLEKRRARSNPEDAQERRNET
jgi:hypothetical protein